MRKTFLFWIVGALVVMIFVSVLITLGLQSQNAVVIQESSGSNEQPEEDRTTGNVAGAEWEYTTASAGSPLLTAPTSTPLLVAEPTQSVRSLTPTTKVTPIAQAPVALTFDDFSNPTSGWEPLYLDENLNFNGYSAESYVFDVGQPEQFLYDVLPDTYFSTGRYDVDIMVSRGAGSFGVLLDVQGEPTQAASLAYYRIGVTSGGEVILQQHAANSLQFTTLATLPPGSVALPADQPLHLGVDVHAGRLRVFVQGQEVLARPGVTLQGGAIGLFAHSTEQPLRVAFDNLLTVAGASDAATACTAIRPLFVASEGDRIAGDDVRLLQQRLTKLGYNPGDIDGIFGSLTEAAVESFQQINGMAPDGIVDAQTWCRLLSSEALTFQERLPERDVVTQLHRAIAISPAADLPAALFTSVIQDDQSWRVALALPGRSLLNYLDTGRNALDPIWSPDGNFLAFTSIDNDQGTIWILDVQRGHAAPVSFPELDSQFPSWSPDSSTILYTGEPVGGQALSARNYLANSITSRTSKLSDVHTGWSDWSVQNELVFTRWTGDNFDLFRSNVTGDELVNLTMTDELDEDIANWSPDGTQIVFVSAPSGNLAERQIFIMQRDGSNRRQVTNLPGANSNPVWLSDGQTIAFANQPTKDTWQPWLILTDGTNARQLSANDGRIWFMNRIENK